MAFKLVIVESPAKAKTIGKILGKDYIVKPCNGHIRDLPKSQLGVDTEKNFEPRYITIRGRGDIVASIKKEAVKAKKVFLATDPDREGEAISWHLAQILNLSDNSNVRVTFNEITEKAVKTAMENPRNIDEKLVDSQQARRILDRLVGYRISPVLWAKVKKGLSAGRVQSVATRLICDREEEIESFVPREYWTVTAQLLKAEKKIPFKAKYFKLSSDADNTELDNEQQAQRVVDHVREQAVLVKSIKKTVKRKNAPAPFITSTLQQEASRKLFFTTKKTMMLVQQLYEGIDINKKGSVGLVTYIRTDSTRISADFQQETLTFIKNQFGSDYVPEQPNVFKGKARSQDAHEAIRPTAIEHSPDSIKSSLTGDQYKLYKLIYNRYIASQMTAAIYESTQVDILTGDAYFRASGITTVFDGYTKVYEESADVKDEKIERLPMLNEGETLLLQEVIPQQHFTQPPLRYTEASLVRILEEKGIGRPSTYAPIVSTILERWYVKREGKTLLPTELGRVVNNLMKEYFPNIVDAQFTAGMEEKLDGIEDGVENWQTMLKDFYAPFEKTVSYAQETIGKIEVKDEVSDVPCDKCGTMMVFKMGRNGKFLACPRFPECRNTKSIVQDTDAVCPQCGAKVVARKSKKGRTFYGCSAYPECHFISYDQPVIDKCPQCGGWMTQKFERGGGRYHLCMNETCGEKVKIEEATKNDE